MHTFPKGTSSLWNKNSLVQDLNLGCRAISSENKCYTTGTSTLSYKLIENKIALPFNIHFNLLSIKCPNDITGLFCLWFFLTVVLIFIIVCQNTMFRLLYPLVFLRCPLFILGIGMIQPGKSFLKFECLSNKMFKNYEDLIQIHIKPHLKNSDRWYSWITANDPYVHRF